jgi:4-methylaminobutanoate oxidase (formaldehyde-forming)
MERQARVAIIGGGIVGCSVAYHLTKLGWRDVVVLEKGELTSGSTWHAAGLVGQLRSSRNITRMLQESVALYRRLEAETGQATGWREVGGLRLASSADRMIELKKAATTAKSFGLEMHLLSPQEAQALFPLISLDGVVGAAYLPTDGYADPSGITQALAKGARDGGAIFRRFERVLRIDTKGRRATTIHTEKGTLSAEIVVNAAGMWAREIGEMVGISIPLIPTMHQYMITEKIPDLPENLPTLRDPDHLIYYKPDVGALVMGGYEGNPIPWSVRGIPKDFGQQLLPSDMDHFAQLAERALYRTPLLERVGMRELINGPEAFTPDGHFIMGRAPALDNFYVAAGFNAHGIAAGGGAGKMLAEWIIQGSPSLDLWPVDIRRFGEYHRSLRYTTARTLELYAKHYTIHWPREEHSTGRPLRCSPLYATLKEKGAIFGAKFGWERPNFFIPPGNVLPTDYAHTFSRPASFPYVAAECKAIRETVAVIDQSSFSKFEIRGAGALEALQGIAANDLRKPLGRLTYTQLCNARGGIECDLTISRFEEDLFYITTGTAFGTHDKDWIERHLPQDGSVELVDVSAHYAVLNLCGPASRHVLQQLTDQDLSHTAFPFAHCRTLYLGDAPVRALRVTYVGELGWELHIPSEYALHLYMQLKQAGEAYGLVDAGYYAIESLRLEKGYRYWSADITPDDTPFEAGLGFCVSFKKPEDFLGRTALEQAKAQPLKKTLCCFTLDEDVELFGGETICHQGRVLGVLSSGGYGHTIKKTIAYGYLPTHEAAHTRFEIETLGRPIPATRHHGVLYDPERKKILC